MTLTGVDTIRTFKTRSVDVELKEGEKSIGTIRMARLPIEELVGYYEMFETLSSDSKNMFKRDSINKMMKYMVTSILSANDGANVEETKEFVATNFFMLFEKFSEVNGGGMDIKIPEDVKRELDKGQ